MANLGGGRRLDGDSFKKPTNLSQLIPMKKTILALALAAGLTSFAGSAKADFNYSFTPGYAFGTGWNILSPVTGTIFGSFNANGTIFNMTAISAQNGIYSSTINDNFYNTLSNIGGIIQGQAQANDFASGKSILIDFSGGQYGPQSIYQVNNNDYIGNGVSTATVSNVPEPSSYALFGIGALVLVIAYRRKVA